VIDVLADFLSLRLKSCAFDRMCVQRDHYDGVGRHADTARGDDRFDLLVAELPVPVRQARAVVMAGPQRPW